MDRVQRGLLLVEQEEAVEKVQRLTARLKMMGEALEQLGKTLQVPSPERTNLKNAPGDLSDLSQEFAGGPYYEWASIPSKEDVTRTIQELRRWKLRLMAVQAKLKK